MTFAEESALRASLGARAIGILEAILILGQLSDPAAAEAVVREWYATFEGTGYKPRTLREVVGKYDDDWTAAGQEAKMMRRT